MKRRRAEEDQRHGEDEEFLWRALQGWLARDIVNLTELIRCDAEALELPQKR